MWTRTLSPGFTKKCVGVRNRRIQVCGLRARWPGRHAVGLDEREVDRLLTIGVALGVV